MPNKFYNFGDLRISHLFFGFAYWSDKITDWCRSFQHSLPKPCLNYCSPVLLDLSEKDSFNLSAVLL